jgi:hypothetical protein
MFGSSCHAARFVNILVHALPGSSAVAHPVPYKRFAVPRNRAHIVALTPAARLTSLRMDCTARFGTCTSARRNPSHEIGRAHV